MLSWSVEEPDSWSLGGVCRGLGHVGAARLQLRCARRSALRGTGGAACQWIAPARTPGLQGCKDDTYIRAPTSFQRNWT